MSNPDEDDIEDVEQLDDEVLSILYRLDERTKRMDELIEDNTVRLMETQRQTDKNSRKIAKLRGGLVVVGLLIPALITAIVSYLVGLL
jgi:hypothetical protein